MLYVSTLDALIVNGLLHVVILIIAIKENEKTHGSILGIVTFVLAWIPFLGMVMHIASAIVLMMDAAKTKSDVHFYDYDDRDHNYDFDSSAGSDSGGGSDENQKWCLSLLGFVE